MGRTGASAWVVLVGFEAGAVVVVVMMVEEVRTWVTVRITGDWATPVVFFFFFFFPVDS